MPRLPAHDQRYAHREAVVAIGHQRAIQVVALAAQAEVAAVFQVRWQMIAPKGMQPRRSTRRT
eukprot:119795-Pleurochrysis_carterae.AAC.2